MNCLTKLGIFVTPMKSVCTDLLNSLTMPVQRDSITFNEVETTGNEPFATFTFLYRSIGQSQVCQTKPFRPLITVQMRSSLLVLSRVLQARHSS
jgi:hypothetical protein